MNHCGRSEEGEDASVWQLILGISPFSPLQSIHTNIVHMMVCVYFFVRCYIFMIQCEKQPTTEGKSRASTCRRMTRWLWFEQFPVGVNWYREWIGQIIRTNKTNNRQQQQNKQEKKPNNYWLLEICQVVQVLAKLHKQEQLLAKTNQWTVHV